MATKMLQRRGTATEWSTANPILGDGEIGFVRDAKFIKIGDGLTAWNALPELDFARLTRTDVLGWGQLEPHNKFTDFNLINRFGVAFVQGGLNGPGIVGGTDQYYVFSMGLGSEYPYTQYVNQVAYKRGVPGVFASRFREAGVWGAWTISTNVKVANAGNADTLGGQARDASTSATANTVVGRDGSGDIYARLLRSNYAITNPTVNFIMTQVTPGVGTDNYVRPSTPAQVAAAMGAVTLAGNNVFTGRNTFGDEDIDITEQRAAVIETHTRSVNNTYTAGKLTKVEELSGVTVVRTTTLTYTGELLTSTSEVAGGKTITTTLTYSGDVLTGTTRTVA